VPNVQWKTRDDRQRSCPKHVEFRDKNKFGELVRLLALLKRNREYSLAPQQEPQKQRSVSIFDNTCY
jgi:hypothetical protein